jgi:DNA topoisomerase-2
VKQFDMDAAAFRKLEHREHVLKRPGMYIGSVEPEATSAYVFDDESGRMRLRELVYTPGLFKIYDEVVVNAVDHSVRLAQLRARQQQGRADVVPVRKISIAIDRATGVIEVTNDGDGIPVTESDGIYVPELIFGHMLSGSNFDDDDDAAAGCVGQPQVVSGRTVGGQNGIGAKACNVFSTFFEVETVDRTRKLLYKQRFEGNMSRANAPVVAPSGAKRPYTTVRFLPDYRRFGMADGLTEDMYRLMLRRGYDAAAVTSADVAVTLNGAPVQVKTFERYVDLYIGSRGDQGRAYERISDGWEVAIALTDGTGLQQVSFVNGVATLRGGKHVDHVVSQVARKLGDLITSRRKDAAVKPQFIRDNLFVFVRATVPDPAFDSQSKETLVTPASKFGTRVDLSDKFVEKLFKLEGLVDRVVGLSTAAAHKTLAKSDGTKRSTLYGIPKLDDAEWAGTAKSQQCTLILTEGDSAKASALAGLAVVGRQRYGVYPLRGKIMNVCDVSADRVAANAEIAAVKKILGLQSGRAYGSTAELRYGRVMVMTDADHDGSHIRGLLFNLFFQQWPSLLKLEGFMTAMLTPVVKVLNARTKEEREFYNVGDFEAWRGGLAPDEAGRWKSKYYKGLGTSSAEEARAWFKKMRIAVYTWDDGASPAALRLGFDKKLADDRKEWLRAYDAKRTLDYGVQDVPYADFVHRELVHFSQYDLLRSIPSAVDGLKVSQRKALYGCFKRNLKEEVRVAQLAAYISEQTAFHHGESSMQGTLVGMAQTFVGSNNVALIEGVGQFGTRLCGGGDAGAPRYIYAQLPHATRLLFPREDDAVLRHLDDDGFAIEPEYFVPVIPTLLVNGAVGIGTGYSTSVPCFNPADIIAAIRRMLDSEHAAAGAADPEGFGAELFADLRPWYRGFRGSFEVIKGKLCSRGVVQRAAPTKLRVTELPVGYWTEDFKQAVEALAERTPEVRAVSNNSTDAAVDFTVTFSSKDALDAWLSADDAGVSRLEAELKLVSNKGLSMTNMHAFDPRGVIKKYDGPGDVLRDFYGVRLSAYARRKAAQLAALDRDLVVLENKVRFLDLILAGEVQLQSRSTEELDADLAGREVALVDGSFRYLTSMAIASMTTDRRLALAAELESKRGLREELSALSIQDMWRRDLDALGVAILATAA